MSEQLVPGWLQRLAAVGWRVLVTIAFAALLVQLAIVLSTVTVAILIALIIAATFAPYVERLRARSWSRTKAAGVVSLLALGTVTGMLIILALIYLPYVADVVASVKAGGEAVEAWLNQADLPPALNVLVGFVIESVHSAFGAAVSEIVGPIAAFVTSLILGGFTVFFLLQDGDRAWAWLLEPVDGWRASAIGESGRVAMNRVGGYLRGTTILAGINSISAFVFMWVLGIPTAGPLAVLVFLGTYIPYLGGLITTAIIVLVALASQGPTTALLYLALVFLRNLVVSNLVRPLIYGRSLGVHPALVLVALPAGAALFGVVGLFAALPVLAFAIAFGPTIVLALGVEPDDPAARRTVVPIWLDRLAQWSWRGLIGVGLVLVVVAAAVQMPLVVIPVVLSVVLAATLDPAVRALIRRGWPRGRASVFVTIGTVLIITVVSVVAIAVMVGPLEEMLQTSRQGASQGVLGDVGIGTVVEALQSGAASTARSVIEGLSTLGIILLLSTLLTFYLLRDGERAGRALVERFGGPRKDELLKVGVRSVDVLGGYMIATGAISLFGAATQAVIMLVLGLPLVLPIAVLSFFLGFIPYIGSFLATALAFLVTVAVGSPTDIAIMAIWTVVFNIVQGNFVAPLVYGRAVSLHPAVVLLAIPAGNAIAGVMGMFLVVPFLGVVAVSWRTVLRAFDPTSAVEVEASSDPVVQDPAGPADVTVSAHPPD